MLLNIEGFDSKLEQFIVRLELIIRLQLIIRLLLIIRLELIVGGMKIFES